jgi:hypothetical protein
MNIRILSKIRRAAHDSVRVVPDGDGVRVEILDLKKKCWHRVCNGYFSRSELKNEMDSLKRLLISKRKEVLLELANDLLYYRRERRLSKL